MSLYKVALLGIWFGTLCSIPICRYVVTPPFTWKVSVVLCCFSGICMTVPIMLCIWIAQKASDKSS